MRKMLRVALRDYKSSVKTKGFIIGLVVGPLFMGGSFLAMLIFQDNVDTSDRRLAVIDHSGVIAPALVDAAEERNVNDAYEENSDKKIKPFYLIEVVEPDQAHITDQRLELSNKIRQNELYAFIEIGPDVVHPGDDPKSYQISYHAENAALDDLRRWISQPINNKLRKLRLTDAGVELSHVEDIFDWISVEGFGLLSKDPKTGIISEARESNEGEAVGVPMVMTILMFLMVMMGAMPLLSATMEEKSQRIAEVMLGSIKPFQFMMGKIIGGVGVSLTAAGVYIVCGTYALISLGLAEYMPFHVIVWFVVFMILNILMVGAILAAIGSACNDAKEAQSVTFPALIPIIVPMFIMVPVLKEPLSGFATWLSLFPPFTPILMLLRLSTPASIPVWQPWVGLMGVIIFAILSIWAGGRIFRVGILLQGQPPKLSNFVRWAFRG